MQHEPEITPETAVTFGQALRAHLVHLYTASGIAFAFLAAAEICRQQPDARWVFVWLIVAVLIDATDGPLARAWHVKFRAPRFDGRKIDDIVDYFTFTFLPLLLVWRLGWLPEPGAAAWVIPALIASVLGFANLAAKQEEEGFFLGFPSYWNIYALYAGLWYLRYGPWIPALTLAVLTVLTVLPVRFLYPNLAPHPWRWPMLAGAAIWLALVLAMLPSYPNVSDGLLWASYVYPALYVALSAWLDAAARRRSRSQRSEVRDQRSDRLPPAQGRSDF